MQEGIYEIGCAVALDSSREDRIVKKIPMKKRGKIQHVLKINFNIKDGTLYIDGNEEIKKDSHKKYLFVDNIGGPNSPQWLATRNSFQYHMSETIRSLNDLDFGEEINQNLKEVLEKFFIDLGEEVDKKYRYILDFKNLNIVEEDLKDEFNKLLEEENIEDKKAIKDLAKKFENKYAKIFQEYIKEKILLKPNEIAIYTILINGKALAESKEYREVVVDKKLGAETKKKKKNKELVCSMCNSTVSNIGDTKKLSIKFYTTNQVIFSSNLTGNYAKNMVLCIDKNLKTSFKLESIYYLTAIRIKDGEMQQYNNLLYMYDAIFTKRRLNKKVIIKSILDAIVIKYFKKAGYNIMVAENNEIRDMIIQSGMYLKFLEYLGCIKGSEKMDVTKLTVTDDIKNYIDTMSYNEEETAMFLLGYLIGEIGNREYKRAGEGKKPILNKLNYSGVDKSKIIRLSNVVFNKLRQEKILTYNEVIYNQCKQLIDKKLNYWEMDKSENLYYILSGYSYSSTKAILNYKKENNEEKEDNQEKENEGGNNNE